MNYWVVSTIIRKREMLGKIIGVVFYYELSQEPMRMESP